MNRYTPLAVSLLITFIKPLCAQSVDFPSPDKSSKVSICSANKLGTDWGKQGFGEYLSISLSHGTSPFLWAGVAYKDETGFTPEVIWSKSSETALFLYRPQRGEVVLGIFRPNSPTKYEPILSEPEMTRLSLGVKTNPASSTKIWTENWKEAGNCVFEGDLLIAATHTRRIHLQVDSSKVPSVVSVLKKNDSE